MFHLFYKWWLRLTGVSGDCSARQFSEESCGVLVQLSSPSRPTPSDRQVFLANRSVNLGTSANPDLQLPQSIRFQADILLRKLETTRLITEEDGYSIRVHACEDGECCDDMCADLDIAYVSAQPVSEEFARRAMAKVLANIGMLESLFCPPEHRDSLLDQYLMLISVSESGVDFAYNGIGFNGAFSVTFHESDEDKWIVVRIG